MRIVIFQESKVMDYHTGEEVAFPQEPSAVTVGSYDGVHAGHRKIIGQMVKTASTLKLRSVVVTFEPHPRQVVNRDPSGRLKLLTLLEEKAMLIERLGVEWLFVVRFDNVFAARSSESFIQEVLVDRIGAKSIVIGYDHGFGRDRKGGVNTLCSMAEQNHFEVNVVDEVRLGSEHFSSTRIRTLLREGDIKEANLFLGSSYLISGKVVHGNKKGRKIGFPTVNIKIESSDKLLPKLGVYIATTVIDGCEFKAMMNIGVRPTVAADSAPVVEAYILGHSGDLYGKVLTFQLLERLRDEMRFSSFEALREQLRKDKKSVEQYQK
ncbi:bifunctional riboflavin kinase/FAD synthetase [Prosthecochloris sp. SCSIO W1102]|uniref:bifunctional riboflavin kinase/FAD synthetase n=1 Tax=Prosthecochloris sp. SCSIO W1102 TaxID=2992243 RepID=UPI00223D28B2|nr:bifunctional riboflavin kinase/FAD synthetase [Prosthecochloris sp. SCSIO W1102]UZJ39102.1 bifunctional riboflavin kinase/FAD synthetase [Prosthecochloris sp. SCSIO W1102]